VRSAAGWPIAAAMAALLAGCHGGAPRDPSRPAADDAIVKLAVDVDDAALWVDGRFVGPVGGLRGGVALAPGKHRIELRHDDYWSHYAELDLVPRQRVTLDVDLAPVLP